MIIDLRIEKINDSVNKIGPLIETYYTSQGAQDYRNNPGIEHYKLLMSISTHLDGCRVLEIGTHHGNSGVALGSSSLLGSKIILDTYDIFDFLQSGPRDFFNQYGFNYQIKNILNPSDREKEKENILKSDLIFIDIDPHEGILEYEMYLWLKNNNFKGIIIFDDIHLGKGHSANGYRETQESMQTFWEKIEDEYKMDLTHLGHWSGTGLVSFNLKNHQILL
jgi:predicted O-methyltransferase YrrM